MNLFVHHPFVRIALFFVLGILWADFFPIDFFFPAIIFSTLFLTICLDAFFTKKLASFHWRNLNGMFVFSLVFLSGMLVLSFHRTNLESKLHIIPNGISIVEIIDEPIEKEKSVKCLVIIKSNKSKHWKSIEAKSWLYLKKDNRSMQLRMGEKLVVNSEFKKVSSPMNPEEFNFQLYSFRKGILFQSYLDEKHWKKLLGREYSIYTYTSDLRKEMIQVLSDHGFLYQDLAVASALIFGYTEDLDNETKNAFSKTGALHVLAVSGLHVGVLYALLNKLLFFLIHFRRGNITKAVILLLALWSYAMITGLSPSVMRAATMFSFVIIGKAIRRNASIYNTLSASAFLLLFFDPYLIYNVGFQLSFLAVIGIVFFHQRIYTWFNAPNKIVDFVWSIFSVSIAAQLITFPICWLYFHQFPNYFLLTNLIVIPLGSLILYLGVFGLLFSGIDFISDWLFFFLRIAVNLLQRMVHWIESFPNAVSELISINAFQCFLLYILLFLPILYFLNRKRIFLYSFMLGISFLFLQFTFSKWQTRYTNEMIVYHISGKTVIDVFSSGKIFSIIQNPRTVTNEDLKFHCEPYRMKKIGLDETGTNCFNERNYFALGNFRWVIWDETCVFKEVVHPMKVDLLIFSGKVKKPEKVLQMFSAKEILCDGSVPNYIYEKIKNCKFEDNVRSTSIEGAFVKKL